MAKRIVTRSPAFIREKNFETYGFTGEFYKLLGDPSLNFSTITYGKAKSGKSTFLLKMANMLAENYKKRILYVTAEEGIERTLQKRLEQLDITSSYIRFLSTRSLDDIVTVINGLKPRFIFIDSAQVCGLTYQKFAELKHSQGKKIRSWHVILQSNNVGQFKGGQEWVHEVDVKIQINNGTAVAEGRFNPQGQMQVFKNQNTLF